MNWFDDVKNRGPYTVQENLCKEYLELYSKYELVITGDKDYMRLDESKEKTLINIRVKIAEGTETQARLQQLEVYFLTEFQKLITQIESQPITKDTVIMYKEKMNKVLKRYANVCNKLGIGVPVNVKTNYTFGSYKKIAERLKQVKAKVDAFMIETGTRRK